MNVLLITFSFPPAGGVGVLRALSLAKYLPEFGVRVDVLTARNAPAVGKDTSLLKQVPASVKIHRTWTLDLPFFLRKAVKKMVSGRSRSTASHDPRADARAPRKTSRLKSIVANLLLPDPQIGWLPFAFPAARRIVRARQIDLILITVPPFSSARLVMKLRASFPGLPIVLDFRDEWLSTTINLVSFNNNSRAREIASKCEHEAVRDATCVVAVTKAARTEIAERYPQERPGKFRYLPNGFDTDIQHSATISNVSAQADDPILMTYIGTVYGSTDPGTFVEAILSLPQSLRSRLRVRYIGHIETDEYRQNLLRLGETVHLQGFIPQAEALRAIAETDYLLLITHDRINVAAKFYDYLAGGKPIFAAVHPEGDVRRLLEETGAGVWADASDPAAIRNLLISLLSTGAANGLQAAAFLPPRNPGKIAEFHRRAITERYAALLSSLSSEASIQARAK